MRPLLGIVLTAALCAAGCATAKNIQNAGLREPYGGVRMKCYDFFGGGQNGGFAAAAFWPIWLVDKPFSFVGDTVTLPYTLWVHRSPHLADFRLPAVSPKSNGPPPGTTTQEPEPVNR